MTDQPDFPSFDEFMASASTSSINKLLLQALARLSPDDHYFDDVAGILRKQYDELVSDTKLIRETVLDEERIALCQRKP